MTATTPTATLTATEEVQLAQTIERGKQAANDLGNPDLSPADHSALQATVQAGLAARDRFVIHNQGLVCTVAGRYTTYVDEQILSFEDFCQEGNKGLLRAIDMFDWRKGFKFSTYATGWIRQAMSRALADQGHTIRVPVHVQETERRYCKTQTRLAGVLGHTPTDAEIAQDMGLSSTQMTAIRQRSQQATRIQPIRLSRIAGNGGDSGQDEIVNLIPDITAVDPEEIFLRKERRALARAALSVLTPREQNIITLRFGLDTGSGRTLDEVGREIGITRERVRQLEKVALSKLRDPRCLDRLRQLLA